MSGGWTAVSGGRTVAGGCRLVEARSLSSDGGEGFGFAVGCGGACRGVSATPENPN